jgi:excisionase family DNA binding protein
LLNPCSGSSNLHASLIGDTQRKESEELETQPDSHCDVSSSAGNADSSTLTSTSTLLDVLELADYLRVPQSWVYDNHQQLELPALRVGRHLRFRASDIEKWLESRKRVTR